LEIHGIPMPGKGTNAEVEEKVLQVLKIDTNITKDATDVVHRLKGKPKTAQNKCLIHIQKKQEQHTQLKKKINLLNSVTLKLTDLLSMKILPVVKNINLLKPIKKENIYIGNICGLTMGGSISEKMKRMQSLQSKQKTYISSSNMLYDSGFMRLSCGGELLLCLLVAFPLLKNASLMSSFTLPYYPNGCK